MKTSATRLIAHAGFWLSILVMVLMGWALYRAIASENEASGRVNHTYQVLRSVAEVNEAVSRGESAQRGYFLSGDGAFLFERDDAMGTIGDAIARMKVLTADNRDQQERLRLLEEAIAARFAIMHDSVRLGATRRVDIGRERLVSGTVRQASARVQEIADQIERAEQALLTTREAEGQRRRDDNMAILIAAVLAGLAVLVPGYVGFFAQARARQRNETMLRLMADSLPGAMYQRRHDRGEEPRITFLSRGVQNVRGIDAAAAQGALPEWNALVDDIDERDRPGFVAELAAAEASLGAFRHDYRVRHADGSVRWLHHEASLDAQEGGGVLMNGYVTDMTLQKRLEAALHDAKESAEMANRAKSTFLATMSHEIRTPMNGVLGMLELLSLSPLNAEQRTTLGIVRVSSGSLLRIIDDILDFSKIEAGKLEVRPEVASIRDEIEDVHNIYSGNASSKGLLIIRSVDRRISPALLVDPVRLRQILNNFVSNALKFTTEGSIEIRAQLLGRNDGEDRVRFTVKDSGIGIPVETQRRLFQPFNQGDGDPEQRADGTGLGLVICRRLAGLMGGTVEMVSEPGEGTTMTLDLSLPIADPADLPKVTLDSARDMLSTTTHLRRLAPSVAEAELEGTLVLLADDHPINRILLMRQVHTLGYAAESAENGVQALEMWKTGRFAMVITDCNMPEMNGYDLTRAIRALESGVRTPIIACTANALAGEADICLAAGMDDYLVKPVQLALILKKLDQWLPIPRESTLPSEVAAQPDEAAPPFDRSVLAAISGGDAAVERDILADYRSINGEDAATLERAVAACDTVAVARATHRMLGASRSIGALALADACERVARASRDANADALVADMAGFQREFIRLNAYLDSN